MKTSDFYYDLPQELIAQTPIEKRDTSRLMTLDRVSGATGHHHFYDLPDYLNPGDCLILNNSRVLPARLVGQRLPGGGICEVLLLNDRGDKVWECLVRPGRKLRKGTRLSFGNGELTAEIVEQLEEGGRLIRFDYEGIFLETLERLGKMPLPPYIKEELQDQERYQTVYSKVLGSAAAPTAGLHFTPELLEKIRAKGVKIGYVTLHVGLGTFRPVKEDTIEDHPMHSEYCTIPQETADLINETRKGGGRCICVGTTSCRTLESWAAEDGHMEAKSGWTDIYIYPGYRFKVMDGLVTNFHLPESTLIMLVSAFAGRVFRGGPLCWSFCTLRISRSSRRRTSSSAPASTPSPARPAPASPSSSTPWARYWAGAPPGTWSAPARTGPLSAPNFPRCPVIWPGWRRPELPRTRTATCCSSGS